MSIESRRAFLEQLGIGALVVSYPILLEGCQTTDTLYSGLRKYPDQTLPLDLVAKIAEDLRSFAPYPSFVWAGNLIKKSFNGSHSLEDTDPSFRNSEPISIAFKDLGSTVAALYDQGSSRVNGRIDLKRANGPGSVSFLGARTETTKFIVFLNSRLLGIPITPWVYRLMITKEASHPLYLPLTRQVLMEDIRKNYLLTGDKDLEDILIETSYAVGSQLRLPSISKIFDSLTIRIDYAGYWGITPDLAKLRAEGKLTKLDGDVLGINLQALDEALKQGLLMEKGFASYKWQGEVGPFSFNWFNLMEDVYQRNGMKTG